MPAGKQIFLICFYLHFYSSFFAQTTRSFRGGESLEYDVYYNWGLIWVNAGNVTFSVKEEIINGKTIFHFTGEGSNKSNWDWFYKVKDKYESYNDTSTLRPFKYIRNSNDGGDWVYNDVTFDHLHNTAIGYLKSKEHPKLQIDTMAVTALTFDPITMIYYSRNIDFSKFKINDEIPISILLDDKLYSRKITYLGKETIQTSFGKFKCIKFKPTLIPGTLFKEGDAMTVWVTDDDNHIPIKVETPILVGSVKAYLKKTTGIRNEMKAKIAP